MGMKGVSGVGEIGMKGVNTVTGAVGDFFGRSKSKKHVKNDKSKSHKSKAEPESPAKEAPAVVPVAAEGAEDIAKKHEEPAPNDQLVERMPITREGVLEKSGGGNVLKKFSSHKRFCVLQADSFLVFKSQKDYSASHGASDTYPLGEISLRPSKHQHSFEIAEASHHTTFKCASDEELQLWMSAINNNITCMQNNN